MSTVAPGSAAPAPTKGEATRSRILDAAVARFGRDGFRATSVADIARDALVAGSAPYSYFDDKSALFLEAIDQDAAAFLGEGLTASSDEAELVEWPGTLLFSLLDAVEDHPLARRLLAGREPEVTRRVLETPALADLRTTCAERLRAGQSAGTVRPDIDPHAMANGLVTLLLSLLMSVVQLGPEVAGPYRDDVGSMFQAALVAPPSGPPEG